MTPATFVLIDISLKERIYYAGTLPPEVGSLTVLAYHAEALPPEVDTNWNWIWTEQF